MRAFLLAAGLGTRLRPLTLTMPKCLVPIRGRPLLDHWLDRLARAGVERVLVNTHWLADKVAAHVAASPHAGIVDLAHEDALLGTAGSVLANRAWLGDAPFLLAHADNLTRADIPGLIAAHRRRPHGCVMTMLAFRTDAPRDCGILEVAPDGRLTAFHEKVADPPDDLANAALYICEPEVVAVIESLGRPVADLSTEVIPRLLGRIQVIATEGYHRDIGSPHALLRAEVEFS